MCGYFHIFCLTAKSQASFTRPPGITINLHSSMLTSRQCTYTENTKRQWTVNKPTNNLNDLICTDLVFSTYFFTFFFFFSDFPAHTPPLHHFVNIFQFLFIFQKPKKRSYGGQLCYAVTPPLLFPDLLFIQCL